jgi:hypothetical protein
VGDLTRAPVDHQEARSISRFDWRLGNQLRWKVIVKLGGPHSPP